MIFKLFYKLNKVVDRKQECPLCFKFCLFPLLRRGKSKTIVGEIPTINFTFFIFMTHKIDIF
jgi:hypothetical protein